MPSLFEEYRPKNWSEVVGQPKALDKITRLRKRGLAGRCYWVSGPSGVGKTTISRLIAREIADPWAITEYDDPAQLNAEELERIRRDYAYRPLGKGTAYILNEAHGCRRDQVRKLLGLTENVPPWTAWLFTTTIQGEQTLFEDVDDAQPLLSQCIHLPLARRDLAKAFAQRAQEIAEREGLNGRGIEAYIKLMKDCRNNLRMAITRIEAGEMAE